VRGTILIVDDEAAFARHLLRYLSSKGYQAVAASTAAEAVKLMAEVHPDIVLMDLRLPDSNGSDLMLSLRKDYPDTGFIIVTGFGSIRSAVEATRRGASDYLTKPFEIEELLISINNVLEKQVLAEEIRILRSTTPPAVRSTEDDRTMISRAMRRVMALAARTAEQDGAVLLEGESGTGKDHLARWIHRRSRRKDGPFFSINCSALPRDLAESELFGHEPGAFTGSQQRKKGLLELAGGGTLLLNEVGEMDLALQSKLLTFLDTHSIIRVGGERTIDIDARIIAATNRDLLEEVEAGRFRHDLFYRLDVFPIKLPPLRERPEDIPGLADHFIERLSFDMGLAEKPVLDGDALEMLSRNLWPGNIRELRNVLERALMGSADGTMTASSLSLPDAGGEWRLEVDFPRSRSLHDVTSDVARAIVEEALKRSRTRQDAARLLGISRHALAYQIKTLGIDD
jgi:DNA-binding NtrC family response regulator